MTMNINCYSTEAEVAAAVAAAARTARHKRAQEMERQILRRIVADALAAGYTLSVDDGEEITVRKSSDPKVVLAALQTTDEDYLYLHRADSPYKGWVRLVYGNDGYDVICDYSVNIEEALAGAIALGEKLDQENN